MATEEHESCLSAVAQLRSFEASRQLPDCCRSANGTHVTNDGVHNLGSDGPDRSFDILCDSDQSRTRRRSSALCHGWHCHDNRRFRRSMLVVLPTRTCWIGRIARISATAPYIAVPAPYRRPRKPTGGFSFGSHQAAAVGRQFEVIGGHCRNQLAV